ncbi:hypothetical protein CLOM_g8713 [Closterium sp. NIES-68]|nr:hypothetical protein CLOM_g8713 [Closterium sp. NIES-68]
MNGTRKNSGLFRSGNCQQICSSRNHFWFCELCAAIYSIPNMGGLTGPLTDLLQKGASYEWGEKQQAAFKALKTLLVSPPVLRIADPERPFEVITDACEIAIGAVLMQDFGNVLQPIAYESKKMQSAERNYPVHGQEMLAVVNTFKIWRCYLTEADMTVRTDHKSLQ